LQPYFVIYGATLHITRPRRIRPFFGG